MWYCLIHFYKQQSSVYDNANIYINKQTTQIYAKTIITFMNHTSHKCFTLGLMQRAQMYLHQKIHQTITLHNRIKHLAPKL
jgi:hypothetical protein